MILYRKSMAQHQIHERISELNCIPSKALYIYINSCSLKLSILVNFVLYVRRQFIINKIKSEHIFSNTLSTSRFISSLSTCLLVMNLIFHAYKFEPMTCIYKARFEQETYPIPKICQHRKYFYHSYRKLMGVHSSLWRNRCGRRSPDICFVGRENQCFVGCKNLSQVSQRDLIFFFNISRCYFRKMFFIVILLYQN